MPLVHGLEKIKILAAHQRAVFLDQLRHDAAHFPHKPVHIHRRTRGQKRCRQNREIHEIVKIVGAVRRRRGHDAEVGRRRDPRSLEKVDVLTLHRLVENRHAAQELLDGGSAFHATLLVSGVCIHHARQKRHRLDH